MAVATISKSTFPHTFDGGVVEAVGDLDALGSKDWQQNEANIRRSWFDTQSMTKSLGPTRIWQTLDFMQRNLGSGSELINSPWTFNVPPGVLYLGIGYTPGIPNRSDVALAAASDAGGPGIRFWAKARAAQPSRLLIYTACFSAVIQMTVAFTKSVDVYTDSFDTVTASLHGLLWTVDLDTDHDDEDAIVIMKIAAGHGVDGGVEPSLYYSFMAQMEQP